MPDSDRRHSPGKSMDDWEGVLLYRTIDSLLKKNVNGIPIGAAVHGDRLAAILLPEFVRQVEMHRGELVAGLRGLRRYLNSIACEMNPWGLQRWALSWVARINHDAVRIALTNMYRPDDPFRQAVEDLDPEKITAYFRTLGRVSVETQPFRFWEDLLHGFRFLTSSDIFVEPFLGQILLRQISFQGPAAVIAREKIWAIQEDVRDNPADFDSILVKPNEALVELCEAWSQWGGDIEKAMEGLWNAGARAGGPKNSWESLAHGSDQEDDHVPGEVEGFQDAVLRLLTTVDDVTKKNSLIDLLQIGSEGKLISYLKKATHNDLLDGYKRTNAQKRKGDEDDVYLSQLEKRDVPDPDATEISSNFELTADLERIAKTPGALSRREKEAVLLRLAVLNDSGELLTFEDLGARMGVTRGAAKNLWDRAMSKLRGQLKTD